MKVLVINSGSSSIKFQVYEMTNHELLCVGMIDRVGDLTSTFSYNKVQGNSPSTKSDLPIENHEKGIQVIINQLFDEKSGVYNSVEEIKVIGHRVVHGGEHFKGPIVINNKNLALLQSISHLAPLHNPANVRGIEIFQQSFPDAKQVAVFDTSFHQSIPEKAFRYAIPNDLYTEKGIRVYGMHGTSHLFISKSLSKAINIPLEGISLISIHLGNGCSVAAISNGRCLDTSMGFSPLDGLVMGTRSGDIDPAVLLYLIENLGYTAKEVNHLLNKESGLKGLTGTNDLRDIIASYDKGDPIAALAIDIYSYRIKKYIASYIGVIGKPPHAIVFTGGVGENASIIREKCLLNLQHMGLDLDLTQNSTRQDGIREIQSALSKIKIMVIPTNEELEIADQAFNIVQ